MNSANGSKRRKKDQKVKVSRGGLAMGYEVLQIRDEGDEGMFNFPTRGFDEARKREES